MKEKIRMILVFILIGFLLFTTVFISGCTQSTSSNIKSKEDVGKSVENMSLNIEDISSTLSDIDKKLG